jgi:hypothetical protein
MKIAVCCIKYLSNFSLSLVLLCTQLCTHPQWWHSGGNATDKYFYNHTLCSSLFSVQRAWTHIFYYGTFFMEKFLLRNWNSYAFCRGEWKINKWKVFFSWVKIPFNHDCSYVEAWINKSTTLFKLFVFSLLLWTILFCMPKRCLFSAKKCPILNASLYIKCRGVWGYKTNKFN